MNITLDVRYRDLDTLGHVNNAVYLTYFEYARLVMFRAWFTGKMDPDFLIAHAEVDYLQPVFLGKITIHTRVSIIGTTSFTIEYKITNADNKICARGKTVQVVVDPVSGEKIRIEGQKREFLEALHEW